MVEINSGPIEATDKFKHTPKDKWGLLLIAKQSFLSTNLAYDCRCLIEFCEEAEEVYADLGYASSEEMIREGYELDPSQIELAVAWLNANGTEKAIPLSDVIKAAKDAPLAKHGNNQHSEEVGHNNIMSSRQGTDTTYTLRRLARDAPEFLDEIEKGNLSVNAAAIKAGIRKKPTAYEIALKAAKKLSVDERKSLIKELSNEV